MPARLIAICFLLSLASCEAVSERQVVPTDPLEAELTDARGANATDPQIMAALADPIMIDPQLSGPANPDAVRPAPAPYSAAIPHPGIARGTVGVDEPRTPPPAPAPLAERIARQAITLSALAAAKGGPRAARCRSQLTYSAAWATRLPPEMPLHPEARVIEAGGVEDNGCSMRVANFYVARPVDALVRWYHDRARKAGYSTQHQLDGPTHLLRGNRPDDDAYLLLLTDRGDGDTGVELVTAR